MFIHFQRSIYVLCSVSSQFAQVSRVFSLSFHCYRIERNRWRCKKVVSWKPFTTTIDSFQWLQRASCLQNETINNRRKLNQRANTEKENDPKHENSLKKWKTTPRKNAQNSRKWQEYFSLLVQDEKQK